jgi:hypothetical protein
MPGQGIGGGSGDARIKFIGSSALDLVSTERTSNLKSLANLESNISQEQDSEQLRRLEDQKTQYKNAIERWTSREARLRVQETDAAMSVQNAKAKWQDLSDQLSALSLSLESDNYVLPAAEQTNASKPK